MTLSDRSTSLRSNLEHRIADVEGHLHPAEAWELHEAARRAGSRDKPAVVAEIGSWKGRSAISLALGLQASEAGGVVHAIDPVIRTLDDPPDGPDRRYAEFLENLDRAGVSELVHPMRVTGHEARDDFHAGTIDVLFIDGDHSYSGVIQDIDDYIPKLTEDAVVGFNDPFLPDVRKALVEKACNPGTPLRDPRFVVNTIFFVNRPRDRWTKADSVLAARLRMLMLTGIKVKNYLDRQKASGQGRLGMFAERLAYKTVPRILPNTRRRG
jgi:predicted O-methyltransferase YrrM